MCNNNHIPNKKSSKEEKHIHDHEHSTWNRRSFIQALGLTGAGSMMIGASSISASKPSPLSVALAESENDNILVIVRLKGGNDGLNTIVPVYDYANYANLRPTIRHQKSDLLMLNSDFGIPNYMHHALAEGYIPSEKQADWINPGLAKTKRYPKGIQRFEEQSRDRYVRPDELPRLIDELDKEPNVHIRAAIWLYLLGGARKTELLKATWDNVDWKRKVLKLVDTKSQPYDVHLSSPALAILEGLPRDKSNSHIFPSPRKAGGHLHDVKSAWERIRKAAKLEDVRIHDLRRTMGSWMANSNVTMQIQRASNEIRGELAKAVKVNKELEQYIRAQRRPLEAARSKET